MNKNYNDNDQKEKVWTRFKSYPALKIIGGSNKKKKYSVSKVRASVNVGVFEYLINAPTRAPILFKNLNYLFFLKKKKIILKKEKKNLNQTKDCW